MKEFKSLAEHASDLRVYTTITDPDDSRAIELLARLADEGFLISENELVTAISSMEKDDSETGVSLSSFGVPTHDRPNALHRCLQSFLKNFRTHGRQCRIIVADDSNLPSDLAANLECLRELSRRYPGYDIHYAGPAQKSRFSEVLARYSGVDPDIIEFALFAPQHMAAKACGPNRNALFLEAVGECLMTVDDDVVCRPSHNSSAFEEIEITSLEDPTNILLFPDRATLLNECPEDEIDILELHEGVLGKPLGTLFRIRPELRVKFHHISPDFLTLLETRSVQAKVSWQGIYGDPGSRYPIYYLWKDECTYRQLTAGEEIYHKLSASRQIFRSPASLALGAGGYCQSTALAYDNRSVLPPFMPLRGLDIVFGRILSRYFKGVIAYLPWAVLHDADKTSKPSVGESIVHASASVPYYAILQSLIDMHSRAPFEYDEKSVLEQLGNHLCNIGNLPNSDFEQLICSCVWAITSNQIEGLNRQLHKWPTAPPYWSGDICTYMKLLGRRLTPSGLREIRLADVDEFAVGLALTKRLTICFGKLLRSWPSLIAATRELRSRGISVADQLRS